MEIQTCRKNNYFHLGFIDPVVVNCVTLKDNPQETFDNLQVLIHLALQAEYIVSLQLSVSVFCVELFYFCIIEFFNLTKSGSILSCTNHGILNCDKP
jgi:hypothetical protein